jgi:hypothetical protein
VLTWHAKPNTALDAILRKRAVPVQDVIYLQEL